jgi:hypothetical protein
LQNEPVKGGPDEKGAECPDISIAKKKLEFPPKGSDRQCINDALKKFAAFTPADNIPLIGHAAP